MELISNYERLERRIYNKEAVIELLYELAEPRIIDNWINKMSEERTFADYIEELEKKYECSNYRI